MSKHESNRWKGFIVGAVGGLVGTLAIGAYWQAVTALTGADPRQAKKQDDSPGPLDSISLVGQQHQKGESSTAAMGRIGYQLVTGKPPKSKETRALLSNMVHWAIGTGGAAAYGVLAGQTDALNPQGGVLLGTAMWLVGDELLVPLLGLSDGPTASPPEIHAYGFGAHMAYGLAVSLVARVLGEIIP